LDHFQQTPNSARLRSVIRNIAGAAKAAELQAYYVNSSDEAYPRDGPRFMTT
jgi:hypothetical protein